MHSTRRKQILRYAQDDRAVGRRDDRKVGRRDDRVRRGGGVRFPVTVVFDNPTVSVESSFRRSHEEVRTLSPKQFLTRKRLLWCAFGAAPIMSVREPEEPRPDEKEKEPDEDADR